MSNALKNEIHAYFGVQNSTTTAKVSQWASGQKLVIHDEELPPVFEAYYSNSRHRGDAKPQIGSNGVVDAPYEFFKSGKDIYVFLMVHETEDDSRYEKVVHIPIDPCPKPTGEEPEPHQQGVIDQTIAALNNALEQSETNVTHYPCIIDGYWHVWDAQTEQFASTGVEAQGEKGDGGLCIFLDRTGSPIPTDADKHLPASATVTCGVYCFKGGERIDPENVTASAFQYKSGQYSASLPATITHNTAEAAQWRVTYNLNASNNITLLGDSGSQLINVTVDGEVHKIYYPWFAAKQGKTGEGGLNIDLTRDAIIIPTDPNRMPDSEYVATIDITADRDGEVVGIANVSATIVSMEYVDGQGVVHRTGVVPSITAMRDSMLDIDIKYTVKYKFKYDPYYFVADSGTVTITIRIGSKNYTRTIPWTLSKQGDAGADAVNVFLRDPVTLIPTDADGYLTEAKIITTTVYAFKGGEPCTITSVTASNVTVEHDPLHLEGISADVTVALTSAIVKYVIPAAVRLRNDRQIPTITTVVDGESYVNTMCIASAKKGDAYNLTQADREEIAGIASEQLLERIEQIEQSYDDLGLSVVDGMIHTTYDKQEDEE